MRGEWLMRVNLFGDQSQVVGSRYSMMLHFVPWKPKLVMKQGCNGDMTPVEEPMTWVDAAKVAAVLSLVQFFADYSMQHPFPYPGTAEALTCWLIQGVFFLLRQFFILFASLTGLTLLGTSAMKKTKKKE